VSKTGKSVIGVLHPGAMGTSLAAALVKVGHRVYWASENRSVESAQRATAYKLHDCRTLASLCKECNVIFSVCPPSEALTVARATAASGFNGTYVDCNAVSPSTSNSVADVMTSVDIDYVDGGVIGPPAWSEGTTRLFLSGPKADEIAELFSGSLMDTVNLGEKTDTASAMKMAYAAWTKGSSALLAKRYWWGNQNHTFKQEIEFRNWGLIKSCLRLLLATPRKPGVLSEKCSRSPRPLKMLVRIPGHLIRHLMFTLRCFLLKHRTLKTSQSQPLFNR